MTLRKENIATVEDLLIKQTTDISEWNSDRVVYHKILESSGQWQLAANEQTQYIKFLKRISRPSDLGRVTKASYRWMLVASVTTLLMIGTWLHHFSQQVNIKVPLAEIQTIWLPDSSKVVLNADANLQYSKTEWEDKNRRVYLEGIAYFEVKRGSKFEVQTKYGDVTVLGTSFNVKAHSDQYTVECFTGSVAVRSINDQHDIILKPGFKVEQDKQTELLIPSRFDTQIGMEWIEGIFNFENKPLDEVWEEFERQYDIQVNSVESVPRYYTGAFSNLDINMALEAICKPMGIAYEINESNKIITIKN